MSGKHIKKTEMPWGLLAMMIVLAAAVVYFVKTVLSGDSPRKKDSVTVVTMLKPPPPPPRIKEKPPEEVKPVQTEEKIIPREPQPAANQDSKADADQDNTPAGDNLGVDAEGTAGGDAFGLVGKKGGKSILAGGGSGGLGKMGRFAGYTHIAETEINKRIMKRLDEEGGVPKGRLQVVARVRVDGNGTVVDYSIIGSSGNHKMDEAVKQSLNDMKISEPPPDGKPSTMTVKIVYSVG